MEGVVKFMATKLESISKYKYDVTTFVVQTIHTIGLFFFVKDNNVCILESVHNLYFGAEEVGSIPVSCYFFEPMYSLHSKLQVVLTFLDT